MGKVRTYIIIGIFTAVILAPFAMYMHAYIKAHDMLGRGDEFRPALSTKLYDRNGVLISELYDENRSHIEVKDIPEHVRNAFIAAEDRSFFLHRGIDIVGILRALIIDIFSGSIKQGGSTITQQLVKQLYTKREKTIHRKLLELIIAMEFERRYSKNEILEMYLNQIYFGHGVYGVGAAAEFYFGKNIKDVTMIEAALLASLPTAPNRYSPIKNPRKAYRQHMKVLHSVVTAGFIDRETAMEKFGTFWKEYRDKIMLRSPTESVRSRKEDRAPYFTEYIRRLLVAQNGEDYVYRGGLTVNTTLDLKYQETAWRHLKKRLEQQQKLAAAHNRHRLKKVYLHLAEKANGGKIKKSEQAVRLKLQKYIREELSDETGLLLLTGGASSGYAALLEGQVRAYEMIIADSVVEGAFVALEPDTGAIRTMIGGREFTTDNQLNRAVQARRQPGSAFKAFIYGAGIESKRITLGSSFNDMPIVFRDRIKNEEWSPSNYGKSFRGMVLTREAFALSLNIVSVLVYNRVGGKKIAEFASKMMNIPVKRFEVDPTLALGTSEVTLLEMARGFGVVASGGLEVVPRTIMKITDRDNRVVYEYIKKKEKRKRIISVPVAYLIRRLMRGVVDYGTAYYAIKKNVGLKVQGAGKTGTNTDFRDAWFVGFTPDLVGAVWLGCDSQLFTLASGQSGAIAAAPVWGNFMKDIYKERKVRYFSRRPAGIVSRLICGKTGKIPASGCPVRRELFLRGTGPSAHCNGVHSAIPNIFKQASSAGEEDSALEGLLESAPREENNTNLPEENRDVKDIKDFREEEGPERKGPIEEVESHRFVD